MTQQETGPLLVEYSRRAYARGLVGGTGGNFSARVNAQEMIITASGISLGDTCLDQLVHIDIRSHRWQEAGPFPPSKEFGFHAEILRLRPDVGAVLHCHSPHATAYAVRKLDIPMVTDAAFKQPPIPRVPFAPSGSDALKDHVVQAIEANPDCKVLLLEQHGVVALGTDIVAAYNGADLIEELARIAHFSQQLEYIADKVPS